MMDFKKWFETFDYETDPEMPHLVQTQLDKIGKYKVVTVDVGKFDNAWSKDKGMYLVPGGRGDNYIPVDGEENRYHRVGKELPLFKSRGEGFDMPTVRLKAGVPIFVDGRHRFAYLRDKGFKTLPVSVPKADAAKMQKVFGIQ